MVFIECPFILYILVLWTLVDSWLIYNNITFMWKLLKRNIRQQTVYVMHPIFNECFSKWFFFHSRSSVNSFITSLNAVWLFKTHIVVTDTTYTDTHRCWNIIMALLNKIDEATCNYADTNWVLILGINKNECHITYIDLIFRWKMHHNYAVWNWPFMNMIKLAWLDVTIHLGSV